MAKMQVTGYIDKNGKKQAGEGGFDVVKGGTGLFTVVFHPPFASTPIVNTTLVYPGDLNSGGGNPGDNSVIVGVSESQVKVLTGDGNNNHWDCAFMFDAVGVGLDAEQLARWEAEQVAAGHRGQG